MRGRVMGPLARYMRWLHTRWPAGRVEKLPRVREDCSTNVPGLYVVGDLTGIPLLKFAADSGARVAQAIAADPALPGARVRDPQALDLVIIGAGVSGMAAALEARARGLRHVILEAAQPFATIVNFPRKKPIYAYPEAMTPAGSLRVEATARESLIDELLAQTASVQPRVARAERVRRAGARLVVELADGEPLRAHRVIVAIGRSGNFRRLGVPGEDLDKVSNRLHDPRDFAGRPVLVVGGGDSAVEAAIALAQGGARVTLAHRGRELSRPKPANLAKLSRLMADPTAPVAVETPSSERVTTASGAFFVEGGSAAVPGSLEVRFETIVRSIASTKVVLETQGGAHITLPNEAVFTMLGREAPLDFFRRSGVRIQGETTGWEWVAVAAFFLAVFALYDWKADGFVSQRLTALGEGGAFPANVPDLIAGWGETWSAQVQDRSSWLGTMAVSAQSRSFYYTLLYTLCIGVFGWLRIRRRRTPYVTVQTACLFLIQLLPLFLLPEILLPYLGYNGVFAGGWGQSTADALFPLYAGQVDDPLQAPAWGHPRAYWHAYGLILAWPLSVYNVFTAQPMAAWLWISFAQTCVFIPLLIYFFGKGAYCGWICSCGGLAETLGDTQRHKMPHGPGWNRLNMVGQALLALAIVLLGVRIAGWIWPESWADRSFTLLLEGKDAAGALVNPLSWKWSVDVLLGGIIGVGLYFKASGRVWCRFACPLAALMHIYARFSRFRILAEKQRCISCNVCTSVCHQGIDVMNFANKGLPMADPQCVRCSACVQSCPTAVLSFGQVDRGGRPLGAGAWLRARRDMPEAPARAE